MSLNVNAGLIKEYKAEFFLLIVTLTWGLSFPIVKLALVDFTPFVFVFLRFLATVILFVIIYRNNSEIFQLEKIRTGLILGIFLYMGYAFQTLGMVYTTASKSAFITGINLMFVPFIQFAVLKLKPGLLNIIGAIMVLAGLYYFTGAHLDEPNLGDILTIFCALSFALHIVLLSKFSERSSFEALAAGQFYSMTFLGLLFVIILENRIFGEIRLNFSPTSVTYLLAITVFSTLLGLILMAKFQKFTTPFRAGIIYNMEGVFAAVFSYFMLGEVLTGGQVISISVMVAGLLLSESSALFNNRNETA